MIDVVTKIELLPCPYCGKDAAEFATAQEMEDCKYFEDETKCPAFKPFEGCTCNKIVCNVQRGGCGASTGYAWNKIQAAMKWNKRARIKSASPTGSKGSDKVNCDKTECYNCVNHGYCDYEVESEDKK